MSEIKVNKISPSTGTNTTLGDNGDKVIVPTGVEQQIKTGADILIESGADINLASGGDINVASGGTITIDSGGTITNNGTAAGFFSLSDLSFPTVTGMTENAGGTTTVVPNTSTACTITGTNFVTGATINLISTTGAILNPETVSFTNTTTLAVSINIPEGSYFVRVENSNGLSGRSSSNTPTWVTNSGSLGTFAGGTTGTITTIVATSTDASPALNMTATSTLTGSSTNQANCQLTVNTVGTTTTGTIASSGGLGINESAATD